MTDKVQKIREEVERLKSNLIYGACSSQIAMETRCKEEAYNEILAILDTMQKEPVSEDLEIAANEWDAKASFTPFYMALDDNGNPYEVRQNYTTHSESFKAGAKWQKEQIMTNAIDAKIGSFTNGTIYDADFNFDSNLKDNDKVKVIVIKEN